MKSVRTILLEELYKYKKIYTLVKAKEKKIKGESLVIRERGEKVYYYKRSLIDGKLKLEYILPEDIKTIRDLAQKSYNSKIESYCRRVISLLVRLLKIYRDDAINKFYSDYSDARKKLVTPIVATREQLIDYWKDNKKAEISFENIHQNFISKNGEKVRSKSEKIIADIFYDLSIDYIYEKPLKLKNGNTIYPDFTFLHPLTNQEIYWEHNGMMDYPEYSSRMVDKINNYAKSGIFQGDRLILTFETIDKSPDYNKIAEMAKKLLILE